MKTGILLVNVGTPDDPTPEKVKEYLDQFLMDPYVIDLPYPFRWFLVKKLITPKRSHASSEAYKKIWTSRGSPLKFHTEDLVKKLANRLGDRFEVEFGMRYRNPSIGDGLSKLRGNSRIITVPMYPQYSLSATETCEIEVKREARTKKIDAPIKFLAPFYRDGDFISASASLVKPYLDGADHVLFSFHGLPEKQIKKMDESGSHCLKNSCCDVISSRNEKKCYRAQSFETARLISRSLGLEPSRFSVSFQSRLNQKWIQPFTDDVLPALVKKGVKSLVVACPSFTTDCLETIEEIGLRARAQFLEAGGRDLRLVPCLNSSDVWVEALAKMIQRN